MNLTYRYRVKSNLGELNRQARTVNFVWNYCNDTQKLAVKRGNRWLTGFDLNNMTAGCSKQLGLPSHTIHKVCEQYVRSRRQYKRPWLRWRGRKSLGWVPIEGRDLHIDGQNFIAAKNIFRVFYSRPIPVGAKICDGTSFSQDSRGNWYLNVVVELPEPETNPITEPVGIDLGLKDLATLSTGEKISNPRHYSKLESKLGIAQRAGKKRLAKKIHSKIANSRRDYLHKESTKIVNRFDHIVVGNVNSAKLTQTRMAKSVHDVGWSTFRQMLSYKAIAHGASYEEVSECNTTRVCSSCGSATGPKGVADLGIRQWVCCDCGVVHDRDVNSALNILARSGHRTLAEGITA
jgi:putative transposase